MKGQGRDLGMEAEERKGRNRPESEGGARIQKGEREKTRGRQLGDVAPFQDAVLGPQRITTVYAKTGRSMPSSKQPCTSALGTCWTCVQPQPRPTVSETVF